MAETLSSGQICARYNITRAGLQKWQEDPAFPPALEPGPEHDHRTRRVWDAGQIGEWRRRQLARRSERRRGALAAYRRRAGEYGAVSQIAHAYEVDIGTLRRWIRDAGLPLYSDAA